MSKQIFRPNIPYHGPVPGGLHDGKMIIIKGTVPYGSDAFEVNLTNGLTSSSDRPFHMSVRFYEQAVVRNSLDRSMWGPEERHGTFPFHLGREFTIMMLVEPDCYRIAVDNHHCWEFFHRTPIYQVNSLSIGGGVQIEKIELVDNIPNYPPTSQKYPGLYPSIGVPTAPSVCPSAGAYTNRGAVPARIAVCPSQPQPQPGMIATSAICSQPPIVAMPAVCPQPPYVAIPQAPYVAVPAVCPQPSSVPHTTYTPVYNPKIPFSFPIPGGLRPGMMIHISGRPFLSPTKFSINIQSGSGQYPLPDIAFHFDVRFTNHSIVRNTLHNNTWEREEKTKYSPKSTFPFHPAANFELTIGVNENKYLVAVNGQQLTEFHHRLTPLARFNTVYVEKDIIVDSIWLSQN